MSNHRSSHSKKGSGGDDFEIQDDGDDEIEDNETPYDFAAAEKLRKMLQAQLLDEEPIEEEETLKTVSKSISKKSIHSNQDETGNALSLTATPRTAVAEPYSEPYNPYLDGNDDDRGDGDDDDVDESILSAALTGQGGGEGISRAFMDYEYFAKKYGVQSASGRSTPASGSRQGSRKQQRSTAEDDDEEEAGVAIAPTLITATHSRGRSSGSADFEIDDDGEVLTGRRRDDDEDDNNDEDGDNNMSDLVLGGGIDIEELMKMKREELEQLDEVSQVVEENKSLSDQYRAELSTYLDKVDQQMDSEGKPLIVVPKNFNMIVNAMTRDDLYDGLPKDGNKQEGKQSDGSSNKLHNERHKEHQNQPWYQYLLSDEIDKEMNKEYNGRYHGILDQEHGNNTIKVKKGLAEILLLDRQLFLLSKKMKKLIMN